MNKVNKLNMHGISHNSDKKKTNNSISRSSRPSATANKHSLKWGGDKTKMHYLANIYSLLNINSNTIDGNTW